MALEPPLKGKGGNCIGKRAHCLGLQTLCLSFNKTNEATLELHLAEGRFVLPVGLDGVYRFAKRSPGDKPAALEGDWRTPNQFVLHLNTVSGINAYELKMTFRENLLDLLLDEITGLVHEKVQGEAAN